MPAKMMSEEPLPTPREVICSPSQIRNIVPPVRVRIGRNAEHQARIADDARAPFETDRDAVGLEDRQHDREIARILVENLAARLAVFLDRLELAESPSSGAE